MEVCCIRIRNYVELKVNVNEYFKGMEFDFDFYKVGVFVFIFIKGGFFYVLLIKWMEYLLIYKG